MTLAPLEEGNAEPISAANRRPVRVFSVLRRPMILACLIYLGLLVCIAVAAPILLPDVAGQHSGDLLNARSGPSSSHPLGTDSLGRDVLERLLVGTRVTLVGALEAVLVAVVVAVPMGLIAGYLRGWWDSAVGWVADMLFSMPSIIIILVVLAVFPHSMAAAMVTLGVLVAPSLMRVVRSVTLAVREDLYVDAAKVTGLSTAYILARHVLPRVRGAVIVQTSLIAGVALLVQSGLAFLNLLVPAPAPSWGGMIADGIENIAIQPWLVWPPGIVVAITILAFGLLSDGVRDAMAESWAPPTQIARPRASVGVTGSPERTPEVSVERHLLSVADLSVSFAGPRGREVVLSGVGLALSSGEAVGVVGESGCGKSTLGTAILGLLPGSGRIESGAIYFDGRNLVGMNERKLSTLRGREIGLISQEPMTSLNPAFRVGWQLDEVVRRTGAVPRSDARDHTLALLAAVDLPDPQTVAKKYPHELSGGMAQRVSIARALAGNPKLLIADEPTTALDVTIQAEILALLRELQHTRNMALLLITHDWGVVADICDRVTVMYAGQVVEQASARATLAEPLHPYTAALLNADPHADPEAEWLPTIPGSVPPPGEWPTGCRFHSRCQLARPDCTEAPIPMLTPSTSRATRCIHADELIRAGATEGSRP